MDWNSILTEILLAIIGVVGTFFTYLINRYIKNEELKGIINSLNDLVRNSVLEVYQTYVEELKDKNIFDEEAQKEALKRCLDLINRNIPDNVEKWLKWNYADAEKYLKSLIEAQIGLLKNGGKN